MDFGFFKTIIGSLELNQEGNTDNIFGFLNFPYSDSVIEDNFYMEDLLQIKNDLSIDSPFAWASEIFSSYHCASDLDELLTKIDIVLNIKNYYEWIHVS